ncbi:MAG TPA: GlsB/YeaQ/YmgE family stress response membrane protein [Hyphomicrobiaceae bacterium]|nr:GlsB/YeaQ/YmgE family stress response membrane protein [Hyphomicrobiaceae bacterium]
MDAKALVTLALIGLVAGFLASLLMGGGGLVRFLVSGVAGAFVGGFLLNAIGVNLGIKNPLISQILTATIGAIVVIIVARFIA